MSFFTASRGKAAIVALALIVGSLATGAAQTPASAQRQMTPQQQRLHATKVAAAKKRLLQLRRKNAVASRAKIAAWNRKELNKRIALWHSIGARTPAQRAAAQREVTRLNAATKRATLGRSLAIDAMWRRGPIYHGPLLPSCATPQISSVSVTQGQPGNPVLIDGSNFGASPGSVQFVVSPGQTVTAAIDVWTKTQILTSVPSVTGIAAPYNGVVYVQTCGKSNLTSFQFEPQIVVQQLPIQQNDIVWSDASGCDDPGATCGTVGGNITPGGAGQEVCAGFFSGSKGDDQFFNGVQLKNGWVLDSVSLLPGWPPDGGNGNRIQTANIGSSSPLVDVHWWVDPIDGCEAYALSVFIHGPAGVPYQ